MRFLWLFGGVLVALVGLAIAFRLAPMPADRWHVVPQDAATSGRPNEARATGAEAPVFALAPAEAAARLDAVARAEGATLLAGDLAQGHATYIHRSRVFGFPDAISLEITADGAGSRVAYLSRSRFGYSDLGVNAARMARWLAALEP